MTNKNQKAIYYKNTLSFTDMKKFKSLVHSREGTVIYREIGTSKHLR